MSSSLTTYYKDEIAELRAQNDLFREALEAIAADDSLVLANAQVFADSAFRRCQTIARAALRQQ